VGALCPSITEVLDPKRILEPVCDGEAAVSYTFRHDTLGPKVHDDVRTLVLLGDERSIWT
jgi:hypothetical protein